MKEVVIMSNEELVSKFQQGEDVFNQLLDKNIGWIRKRAYKHSRYSLYEYHDLENYFIYLMYKALDKYNPNRGVKFITYFSNVIEKKFATMVTRASYVNLERMTLSLNNNPISPFGDEAMEFMDTLPSPHGNVSELGDLERVVKNILSKTMTTKGANIATRYFLDGINTEELASEYGVTREATSKQVRKARAILIQELPKYEFHY